MAMGNLAGTYTNLSRFEDAEKLQTEVMEKFRTILGDEHPHAVLSIKSLASTYCALGKVAEAEELEALFPDDERDISASDAVE
ncbi:hypothetical protein C8F04DRAFT_1121605 [Mycena alexandri]|uniref:Kinesin light chain n=1 Tax=Mycena alexandri TaxID=1745969 RepID=A0AAD6SGS1_9AGAR|nr:hypothetical protein C8F04DRAFT_1121605 [Mycena alexandri]